MPATPHIEKHFTSSETVRDVVIGMSDGLTVPFALAAGLSGQLMRRVSSSRQVSPKLRPAQLPWVWAAI